MVTNMSFLIEKYFHFADHRGSWVLVCGAYFRVYKYFLVCRDNPPIPSYPQTHNASEPRLDLVQSRSVKVQKIYGIYLCAS